MLPQSNKNTQPNLFHAQLRDMLDSSDPLVALADTINWDTFDESFAKYYSDEGRPAKPKRLMVVAIKMIHHLHRIAKEERIQLRRTYVREIKQHRISLRFFKHPRKIKKAKAAVKRLRTIVGILMRDIGRNLSDSRRAHYQEEFDLFEKVRNQQIRDKNKVLSLHESHVYAITKGKGHKRYEYGTKASIGVVAHETNEHDLKTLKAALTSAHTNRTEPIKEAICDRGYRGVKRVYWR